MTQVVVQDFELECVPQACPGAAKHAIDKLPPQLTTGGCDLLADLTEDKAVSRSLITSNQQHVCCCRKFSRTLLAPVAQITQRYSSIDSQDQSHSNDPIIPIAGGQEHLEYTSVHVTQQVQ